MALSSFLELRLLSYPNLQKFTLYKAGTVAVFLTPHIVRCVVASTFPHCSVVWPTGALVSPEVQETASPRTLSGFSFSGQGLA